jgi:hypothetical protein
MFSQPLVKCKVIDEIVQDIDPMTVTPLDNYGEYLQLTRALDKSGVHISLK